MNIKLLKKGLIFFLIFLNGKLSYAQEYHIVKKGETLFSISKLHELPIDTLTSINDLINNSLSIGQKLLIKRKVIQVEDKSEKNKSITIVEEGFASSIGEESSGDKYLALHKSAKVGTIIFVKNQMNENMVIVRVIGKLPETGENDKVNIKLSLAAFQKLNAVDNIIPIEMTYVYEEKKN